MNLFPSKTAITLLVVLVANALLTAQAKPYRRTSMTANSSTAVLKNNFDTHFFYDQNGNLDSLQFDTWNGTDWAHYTYDVYTLNAEGKPIQILEKYSGSNANYIRQTYDYHTDGQYSLHASEGWNSANQAWGLQFSYTFTFTPTNKVKVANYADFDLATSTINVSRATSQFDGQDRISETLSENYTGGNWMNSQLKVFHYPGTGTNYDTSTIAPWTNAGFWGSVNSRNIQTFNGSQRITTTEQPDGNGLFTNTSRYINVDGPNGVPALYDSQTWDAASGSWKTSFKFEIDFNPDGSLHQYRSYLPDFLLPNKPLYLNQVADFFYTPVGTTDAQPFAVSVKASPNPTTDFVKIEAENDAPMTLRLTGMDGRLVQQTRSTGKNATISLLGQKTGVYFLQIEQVGAVKTLPVVKI